MSLQFAAAAKICKFCESFFFHILSQVWGEGKEKSFRVRSDFLLSRCFSRYLTFFREATCENESFSIGGTLGTIVFGPSWADLSVKQGLHRKQDHIKRSLGRPPLSKMEMNFQKETPKSIWPPAAPFSGRYIAIFTTNHDQYFVWSSTKFAIIFFRFGCLQKVIHIERQRPPLVDYLPSINFIDLFSDIGDNMSFVLSMAMALSLTLFSNIVIFFYYNEKVEKKEKKEKAMMNRKGKLFLFSVQVFDLSFSPIMFGQEDNFPIVAIVAPYRLLNQDHQFLSHWLINEFGEKTNIPHSVHTWGLIITETDLFSCGPSLSSSETFWRQKMGFVTGSTLSTRRTHCLLTGTAVIIFVSDVNISE